MSCIDVVYAPVYGFYPGLFFLTPAYVFLSLPMFSIPCLCLLSLAYVVNYVLYLPRVVYIFGKAISEPVSDITPTHLTPQVLSTLREADYQAHRVLQESGQSHVKLTTDTCQT